MKCSVRATPGPKRSLTSREFALGIEALERFVRKEPLQALDKRKNSMEIMGLQF